MVTIFVLGLQHSVILVGGCFFYPLQISPITNPWVAAQSPRTYDIQSDNLVFLRPEERGEIKRHKSNDIKMYAYSAHCSLPIFLCLHMSQKHCCTKLSFSCNGTTLVVKILDFYMPCTTVPK